MSLHFTSLHQYRENFLVTSAAPVYIAGGPVTANDMACLAAWFEITDCSAGINGGNPATITLEYTPDDGTTWVTVPSTTGGSITGNSVNTNIQVTASTGVFPPVIRIKFVAPANEYFTVKKIRRIQLAPGMVAPLRSTGGSLLPGAPSFVELSDGTNALTPFENYVAAQFTAAPQYRFPSSSTILGWNATGGNHLEITCDSAGRINNTPNVAYGTGADSATTQRATLSTRHEAAATPVSIRESDGTNFKATFASVGAAQHTQANPGNVPTNVALVTGWDATNVTHKELNVDTAGNLKANVTNTSFSNTFTYNSVATIPVSDSGTPANNIGMPSVQLAGQGLGPVTMGSGADSVLTPRMTLSTRHEDVATPVSVKLGDGTTFVSTLDAYPVTIFSLIGASRASNRLPVSSSIIAWDSFDNSRKEVACYNGTLKTIATDASGNVITSCPSLTNAQYSIGTPGRVSPSVSFTMGWDNTNSVHKELQTNSTGILQVEQTNNASRSKANAPVYMDHAGAGSFGAGVWTTVVASVTAQATKIHVFDSSGTGFYLAFGGAGAEVSQIIVPPGGDIFELLIPAGTRLSAQSVDGTAISVGSLQMSLLT